MLTTDNDQLPLNFNKENLSKKNNRTKEKKGADILSIENKIKEKREIEEALIYRGILSRISHLR